MVPTATASPTARLAWLRQLFGEDERPRRELEQLYGLIALLLDLPPPPDPIGLYPQYESLRRRLADSLRSDDPERIEESFLELYCHLHGHEAPYTPAERAIVTETGGYWCHAGGLSPLLKAGPWIRPETVSCDYGAGNGLQALLLQKLHPHRRTVQIEISSRMVECGRALQRWLGIPTERVTWVVDDVRHVPPAGMDFIYLYRPVKPVGLGETFYTRFAEELASSDQPLVIFSIADCLRDFLPDDFEIVYDDGHLTCFRRGAEPRQA